MIEIFFKKPKTENHTKDGLYSEYNQWGPADLEQQWFIRFLRHNFPDNIKKINFFGPLSNPFFLRNKMVGAKVFFTGEDVEHPFTKLNLYFGDYALDYVDLGMGFGHVKNKKYLRFPYWITTTFDPCDSDDDIRAKIDKINNTRYAKSGECVLINKHDPSGTRELVYNGIKDVLDVKLAGKWKNNTTDLWDKFGNNKFEYLKTFKFNICAENDNTEYYVTEKLFDAFMSDCIPLYYGASNNPEPELINHDAVIFWNKDGDNKANLELIKKLNTDEKAYAEFMAQTKLLPAAADYVIERYTRLREHFARIIGE